jgi:hypothetical protein
MADYVEPTYKTKSLVNGEIIEEAIEGHLEMEHGLDYLVNGLDFLGIDTLELIHLKIHEAYFAGFNHGVNSVGNLYQTKSLELTKKRLLLNYPYSDLDEDLQYLPDLEG